MEYPKVLIVSHNPFSDVQNNGKTLTAFFEGWPKDKIAQLYLTTDIPDFSVCDNFYRITDIDILKQFFKKQEFGHKINKENILVNEKENLQKNKLYMIVRSLFLKRIPFMSCLRNLSWKYVKPWNNIGFNKWIDDYKPDIVFFQSSNMYSVFDMVNYICNKYKTKLYMETTDDYVTKHFSLDIFYHIDINKLIKKYKMLVHKSEYVFPIGDKMAIEYKNRFGGKYKVAMNSIDTTNKVTPYETMNNKVIRLLYTGNLGLNRWKSLQKIGKVLSKLNKDEVKAKLDIYSLNKPSKKVLEKINIKNSSEYKGALNSEELIIERNNSDILLHVESFDRKNKYITRLSISTKIPECLLAERCLLVFGPSEIASVQYVKNNQIGMVIDTNIKKDIEKKINFIINSREDRIRYIKNGKRIAMKRHNFSYNKKMIQETIMEK